MTAMQEFVVPKSMPKTFAIKSFCYIVSLKLPDVLVQLRCPTMPKTEERGIALKTKGELETALLGAKSQTVPRAAQWHS
jgi:hypothetical protein